jgi:hypothetical protein
MAKISLIRLIILNGFQIHIFTKQHAQSPGKGIGGLNLCTKNRMALGLLTTYYSGFKVIKTTSGLVPTLTGGPQVPAPTEVKSLLPWPRSNSPFK